MYVFTIATIFYYGFRDHCCVSSSNIVYVDISGLPYTFGGCAFALAGVGPVRICLLMFVCVRGCVCVSAMVYDLL